MEEYSISLVASDGGIRHGVFQFDDDADDCTLSLTVDDRKYSASADDYFEALCDIRDQLEEIGLRRNCYGAHVAAYPSGMSRGMRYGLKIYKLTLGQPGCASDLVHLFDVDDEVEPATVAGQRAYYDRWLASLNR